MKGRREEARRLLDEAIDLREAYLKRTLRSSLSEYDRLAFVQELRVHPESSAWPGILDTYLELAPGLDIDEVEQYRRLLAWKGVVARHAPPPGRNSRMSPRSASSPMSERGPSGTSARRHGRHRARSWRDWRTASTRWSDRLGEISPRFQQGPGSGYEDATPAEVTASLIEGSALLDVILIRHARVAATPVGPDLRYVGFLVRPSGPPVRVDFRDADGAVVNNAEAINGVVIALREALRTDRGDFDRPAARLKASIVDRLRPLLDGASLLIVARDGQFHRLPLGVLPGARPGRYWIEEIAFASVSSAQALVTHRRSSRARPASVGALIVGGLDYGPRARETDVGLLPATLVEAEAIAEVFRRTHPGEEARVLTGDAATGDAVIADIGGRRFVHLATHGFLLRARGLGTGLLTAGDLGAARLGALALDGERGSRRLDPLGRARGNARPPRGGPRRALGVPERTRPCQRGAGDHRLARRLRPRRRRGRPRCPLEGGRRGHVEAHDCLL